MTGLTSEQARERMKKGQANVQVDKSAKTTGQIVRENVCTYFNLIFLVLAILCVMAGSYNSLTFLPVIILNTLIGIVQEIHAKKVLDQLSLLNQPTAKAIRDGQQQDIPIHELVLGDVVVLSAGSQIPADAEVVEGEANVNESLLTGEADEIEKKEGDTLLSGSFLVSGECKAELTKVGEDAYAARLMKKAKQSKTREESQMIRSINRLIVAVGIVIIPIGIVMFYQGYIVKGESFRASVESMVAALIGIIPEGMYLLASVALAVSAALLATKKVMLHDMKSTETLARVDTLCVDKTGTITDTSMLVTDIVAPSGQGEEKQEKGGMEDAKALLKRYARAIPDDNMSMKAIRDYFSLKAEEKREGCSFYIPFASKYKYGSVSFGEEGQYLLGAPENVLGDLYGQYQEEIEGYAGKGLRVMVFAKYTGEEPLEEGTPLAKEQTVEPLLFVLLQNPIRENAVETFRYFKEQGVQVKVISGDHAMTVSEVAKSAQIPDAEKYVDASTLKTDEELKEAASQYTVFGRTTPEQKQKLIRAMKREGHTVAMTGDGVNDILAMKAADCSVAMAAGSDAAVQAAQVVLLDSDFSHMPQVVSEGRKVVNNIQRSSILFLVKNIFSMLLALFSIVSVISFPLQPSQLTLISVFNIGIPGFFLAMEPNDKPVSGTFFSKVIIRAMPAALTNFFVISMLVVFGRVFQVSSTDISVASTFLMAIVGFMILFYMTRPMNRYHAIVVFSCIAGFCFCAYFMHDLFSIRYVSEKCIMLFVLFAIATEPFMRYLTRAAEALESFSQRRQKKNKKRRKG